MDEDRLLQGRLAELSKRARLRGIWTYSEFLTLYGQDTLSRMRLDSPYVLEGGFLGAERRLACFGSEEDCGYEAAPPISCIKIAPRAQKYADALSHRDILGSVMALGIKRETLGDIAVIDNEGYLICLESVRDYICENLNQVRHTAVDVSACEVPRAAAEKPDITDVVAASERLDALVAAVYRLSRSESAELFEAERVFVNGRLVRSASDTAGAGDIVSVRGYGRFIYEGTDRATRSGRAHAAVRIFA